MTKGFVTYLTGLRGGHVGAGVSSNDPGSGASPGQFVSHLLLHNSHCVR